MVNFKSVLNYFGTVLIIVVVILYTYSCETKNPIDNQLLGSWNLEEVNWVSKDTTHILKRNKLGILLITDESYGIIWSPTQDDRIPFKKLSNPTDEEVLNGFSSIVFNAGTYIKTDSTMTSTSTIAKVPGFEGGKQFYNYELEGNLLTLIMYDEVYPNGEKPKWSGIWQTMFLFKKIEAE